MRLLHAIAVALVVASAPTFAEDASEAANRLMREALLERAPLPSRAPALPDRAAPGGAITRQHLATDAERAARGRADGDARRSAEEMRTEAAHRAAMAPLMNGCMPAGGASGCAGSMPADMMKSRGMMPGGETMPGGGGHGGGGGGMPGGGMPRATSASPLSSDAAAGSRR